MRDIITRGIIRDADFGKVDLRAKVQALFGDYEMRNVDALSQIKNSYVKNVDALSQIKISYVKNRTFNECCAAAIAWHTDKDATRVACAPSGSAAEQTSLMSYEGYVI